MTTSKEINKEIQKDVKNNKKKILGAVVGVILCFIAYFIIEHIMYVTTDDAQVQGHTLMLATKVAGFVAKVNVVEGQTVKKDDVLIEIDSRDYENLLHQVEGELVSLEARKHDVEKNYQRMASLFGSQSVSQQQYDTVKSSLSEIKAKYDSVAAQVSQAKLNLENTRIKAPSDGMIAKKSVEVGQLAAQGVPLLGFVSNEERWVTANFKETEIEDVKVGNAVSIEVDAITKKSFIGKVESVSSATGATFTLLPPDNATGNFTKVVQRVPVRIQFLNLTNQDIEILRTGLSAVVKVRK